MKLDERMLAPKQADFSSVGEPVSTGSVVASSDFATDRVAFFALLVAILGVLLVALFIKLILQLLRRPPNQLRNLSAIAACGIGTFLLVSSFQYGGGLNWASQRCSTFTGCIHPEWAGLGAAFMLAAYGLWAGGSRRPAERKPDPPATAQSAPSSGRPDDLGVEQKEREPDQAPEAPSAPSSTRSDDVQAEEGPPTQKPDRWGAVFRNMRRSNRPDLAEEAATGRAAHEPVMVVCPRCGTKNRIPFGRSGKPLCGRCGESLRVAPRHPHFRWRRLIAAPTVPVLAVLAILVGAAGLFVIGSGLRDRTFPKTSRGLDLSAYGTPAPAIPGSEDAKPAPICALPPRNAQILYRTATIAQELGHSLEIRNGSGGDAIVKLKNSRTGRTVLAFFVARDATASLEDIPDGSYRIQFAFGDTLNKSCSNFIATRAASQFPAVETLETKRAGPQVETEQLVYTLYKVNGGNVTPQVIDPASFDAD